MKRELTFKELSAYLPYGAKVLRPDNRSILPVYGVIGELIQFAEAEETTYGAISTARLILRPLSQLTEEITHNGETFEPMQRLLDEHECTAEYDFLSAIEDDWPRAPDKMRFAPMSIAAKLLEWHFDIFGLIPDGLAVAMNPDGTLTKNT